jgi:hypothetical protein
MTGDTFRFSTPELLWLLLIPGVLTLLWLGQVWRRRVDVGRCLSERTTPVHERYGFAGPLLFWLFLIGALASCIVALARPERLQAIRDTRAVDLVVVQDASTSMRVRDVQPDRWQRSIAWIRTLVAILGWKGDRVALAVFAGQAAPQVRLARDPNILLFFLDHLAKAPPNALTDDSAWDTNAEEGIDWGLKIIAKDAEVYGRPSNPQAMIVISDGQAWSGEVERSLALAVRRHVPVDVIGVGTTSGGVIPGSKVTAALDRGELQRMALLGGGQYFELGTAPDPAIAARIVADVQSLGAQGSRQFVFAEIYWPFLAGAGALLAAGLVCRL